MVRGLPLPAMKPGFFLCEGVSGMPALPPLLENTDRRKLQPFLQIGQQLAEE